MNKNFVQSPLRMQPYQSYSQPQMIKPEKKSSKGVIFIGSLFILIIAGVIYYISREWIFSAPFVVVAIIFILIGLLGGKKNPQQNQQYAGFQRY